MADDVSNRGDIGIRFDITWSTRRHHCRQYPSFEPFGRGRRPSLFRTPSELRRKQTVVAKHDDGGVGHCLVWPMTIVVGDQREDYSQHINARKGLYNAVYRVHYERTAVGATALRCCALTAV